MLNGASKQRVGSREKSVIPLLRAFTTTTTVISYRFSTLAMRKSTAHFVRVQ